MKPVGGQADEGVPEALARLRSLRSAHPAGGAPYDKTIAGRRPTASPLSSQPSGLSLCRYALGVVHVPACVPVVTAACHPGRTPRSASRRKVRMKRVAPVSVASSVGTLIGHLTVAAMCAVLVAACSTSGGTHQSAATVPTTVSTTTTAKATTTTTTPHNIYRVKRGDTLSKIANQFRVSISAVVARNHVANPDHLREGQTLVIPPAPPRKLIVSPRTGQPGQAFQLTLTGAVPSETIKFQIDSAKGKYTGGPHIASADGAVIATYQTALSDPTGIYTVTASGTRGTTIKATFVVVAAATTDTT